MLLASTHRAIRRGNVFLATGCIIAVSLSATAMSSRKRVELCGIDFRNFTYPFPSAKILKVPDRLRYMGAEPMSTITLVNGRHNFDVSDRSTRPSVLITEIRYGYLTSAPTPDAVVALTYHTGGTAYWHYLYVFSLASERPKLVTWFQTGSRADFGLYHFYVTRGELTLDLFDPEGRETDCCSTEFVRIRYEWRNGRLAEKEFREFGKVADEPSPR